MLTIPQNISSLSKELEENGIATPYQIIECENEEHSGHKLYTKHCHRDKLIYSLTNGQYLILRYNNSAIALEIRDSLNFYTTNYKSIKYFYNVADIISHIEKHYPE